jgi:NADPH:quinone reductase-like Zn-dependent oxidoreductase
MRAAVQVGYGAIEECVVIRDVPVPAPGPGEVLVKVGGTSLNRKDLFALADLRGPGIRPRPPLPHVNGTDAWGTVEAAGEHDGAWRHGDRVVVYPGLFCAACEYCLRGETSACVSYGVLGEQRWGAHAEFVVVPGRNLERMPAGLGADTLACIGGSWLTAWRALVTVAAVRPGETVLVVGASGGVGTAAIRIARAAGCRVIAVAGSDWKARRAREIGADDALPPGEGMTSGVMDLTGGRGVDVAIDSVGGAEWRATIGALAPLGRMAICGATGGDSPPISIREIYQAHRRILGAPLGTRAEFTAMVRAFAAGRLEPVVHTTVRLEEIHEGLRLLERREFFGKVAVSVEA